MPLFAGKTIGRSSHVNGRIASGNQSRWFVRETSPLQRVGRAYLGDRAGVTSVKVVYDAERVILA
jgi:hypothetical protein